MHCEYPIEASHVHEFEPVQFKCSRPEQVIKDRLIRPLSHIINQSTGDTHWHCLQ
jgi:hypothetical protein